MPFESVIQALTIGTVLVINRCFHNYTRGTLASDFGQLCMHVAIEAHDASILEERCGNVVERKFPSGTRRGVRAVWARRPAQDLSNACFYGCVVCQRDVFFVVSKVS